MNIKNTYKYQMGGFLQGASTGASLGSIIPGVGTAIGAIGGGIIGSLSGNRDQERLRQQQQEQYLNSIRDYSKSVLQDYPSLGVEAAGYYKNGGRKRAPKERSYDSQNYALGGWLDSALAENNEVAVAPTPPEVNNGNLESIASNMTKFKGDNHDDPSGGIEFNSTSDTMIFSDELRTEDGVTFAKKAEQIGKRKSKFEKKLENATSSPEYNTAERMIARINSELSELFNLQESLKV